jgi:hypothetical protein
MVKMGENFANSAVGGRDWSRKREGRGTGEGILCCLKGGKFRSALLPASLDYTAVK